MTDSPSSTDVVEALMVVKNDPTNVESLTALVGFVDKEKGQVARSIIKTLSDAFTRLMQRGLITENGGTSNNNSSKDLETLYRLCVKKLLLNLYKVDIETQKVIFSSMMYIMRMSSTFTTEAPRGVLEQYCELVGRRRCDEKHPPSWFDERLFYDLFKAVIDPYFYTVENSKASDTQDIVNLLEEISLSAIPTSLLVGMATEYRDICFFTLKSLKTFAKHLEEGLDKSATEKNGKTKRGKRRGVLSTKSETTRKHFIDIIDSGKCKQRRLSLLVDFALRLIDGLSDAKNRNITFALFVPDLPILVKEEQENITSNDLKRSSYDTAPSGNVGSDGKKIKGGKKVLDGATHEIKVGTSSITQAVDEGTVGLAEAKLTGTKKKKVLKRKRVTPKGGVTSLAKREPQPLEMMPIKTRRSSISPRATSLDVLGKMLEEAQAKKDKEELRSRHGEEGEGKKEKQMPLKAPKHVYKVNEATLKTKTPGYAEGYPNVPAQDAFGPLILNMICVALTNAILFATRSHDLQQDIPNSKRVSEYSAGRLAPLIKLLQPLSAKGTAQGSEIYIVRLLKGIEGESGRKSSKGTIEQHVLESLMKFVVGLKLIMNWHRTESVTGTFSTVGNTQGTTVITDVARVSARILSLWIALHLTSYAASTSKQHSDKKSGFSPSVLDVVSSIIGDEKVAVDVPKLGTGVTKPRTITVSLAATSGIGVIGLEIVADAFGFPRLNKLKGCDIGSNGSILNGMAKRSLVSTLQPFVRNCLLTITEGVIHECDASNMIRQEKADNINQTQSNTFVDPLTGMARVLLLPPEFPSPKSRGMIAGEWQLPMFLTQLLGVGKTPVYKDPLFTAPHTVQSLLYLSYSSSILSVDPPTATRMSILGASPRRGDTDGTKVILDSKGTRPGARSGIKDFVASIGDICVVGKASIQDEGHQFDPTFVTIPVAQCTSSSLRLHFFPETSRTMTIESKEWTQMGEAKEGDEGDRAKSSGELDGGVGEEFDIVPWETETSNGRKGRKADKSTQRLQRLRYMNSMRSDIKTCFERVVDTINNATSKDGLEEEEKRTGIQILPIQISNRRIVDFLTNGKLDTETEEGKEDSHLLSTSQLKTCDSLLRRVITNTIKKDKGNTRSVLLGGRRVAALERSARLLDEAIFGCWK